MPNTVRANTRTLPEATQDDTETQEPKPGREFADAYHAWLAARAADEDPAIEDEDQAEQFSAAMPGAERRLLATPAALPSQLWQKLEAFESMLADELAIGPRTDPITLLAMASIKTDILNLNLLHGRKS